MIGNFYEIPKFWITLIFLRLWWFSQNTDILVETSKRVVNLACLNQIDIVLYVAIIRRNCILMAYESVWKTCLYILCVLYKIVYFTEIRRVPKKRIIQYAYLHASVFSGICVCSKYFASSMYVFRLISHLTDITAAMSHCNNDKISKCSYNVYDIHKYTH